MALNDTLAAPSAVSLLGKRGEQHPLIQNWTYSVEFPRQYLIENVMEGWKRFVKEPQDYKNSWLYERPGFDPAEGPDDGYILREGKPKPDGSGHDDRKEFFHFQPDLPVHLAKQGTNTRMFAPWLGELRQLHDACLEMIVGICDELDRVIPSDFKRNGRSLASGVKAMTNDPHFRGHKVRLLHYHNPVKPGLKMGKGHDDRCFMTIHLAETHPGLRLVLPDKQFHNYVPQRNKVQVFTSKKAEIECPDVLHSVFHDIVTPLDAEPSDELRFSMVFFSHTDAVIPKAQKASY